MRRRPILLLSWPLLALGLAACGTSSVSTSTFSGERHAVAQTVANLQSDANAGEQKKICADDLSSALVVRLGGKSGCETAIKNQLAQVDNLEVSVQSVALAGARRHGAAGPETASAKVKSVYSGKGRESTLTLVKEGGKWKISGLG
jgi:hypothetical protein